MSLRFPYTFSNHISIYKVFVYDEEKGKGILYEVETVFKGSVRAMRGISLLAMVYLQRKVDGVPFGINLCKMVCDTPYSHWKLSVQRKEK